MPRNTALLRGAGATICTAERSMTASCGVSDATVEPREVKGLGAKRHALATSQSPVIGADASPATQAPPHWQTSATRGELTPQEGRISHGPRCVIGGDDLGSSVQCLSSFRCLGSHLLGNVKPQPQHQSTSFLCLLVQPRPVNCV